MNRRKAVFSADWRKLGEQSRVVKIAQTAGSDGDKMYDLRRSPQCVPSYLK